MLTLDGAWDLSTPRASDVTYVEALSNDVPTGYLNRRGEPLKVSVTHHRVLQHTLVFEKAIELQNGSVIELGTCNLYGFPVCAGAGHGHEAERERLLHLILVQLALSEPDFLSPDAAGAYPHHSLGIANTQASLDLLLDIFRLKPELILHPHDRASPFAGAICWMMTSCLCTNCATSRTACCIASHNSRN